MTAPKPKPRPKPFLAGSLMRLGGAVALIAAMLALKKAVTAPAVETEHHAREAPPSASPEIVTYVVGYVLALLLTIAAFALVHWKWASTATALEIVCGLALVQIIVHFRCFLHVTLHGPARDDLQLILFSTVIVILMVAGTLVLLFNLRMRMM